MRNTSSADDNSPAYRLGLVLFALFVLLVFFCVVFTPPPAIVIEERFLRPSLAHWLGTDHYGRDTLRMVLRGGFVSLATALSAVALALLCALPLGFASARTENALLRSISLNAADLLFAFPALLTALLIATLYKPGWLAVLCAITLFNIPVFWKLSRAIARSLYLSPFISAARALGASERRILYKHILPNTLAPLLLHASTQVSLAILAEASFAYLGLGTPPPAASWGSIVREAQNFLVFSSIPLVATACLMVASVAAFSSLARRYAQKLPSRLG